MSLISKIKKKRGQVKLGKKIYQKEYKSAALEEIRKTKKRSRKQLAEKAKAAAKAKHGLTPSERAEARKKKMKAIAKNVGDWAEGFESDDFGFGTAPKPRKRTTKKKTTTKKKHRKKTHKTTTKPEYVIIGGKAYIKGTTAKARKKTSSTKHKAKKKTKKAKAKAKSPWEMDLSDF